MSVVSRTIHSNHSPNCQRATIIIGRHVLHHLKVRKNRKANYASDTLIAVGGAKPGSKGAYYEHTHAELFTLSSSKWQIKKEYPYSKQITLYSILAVEKMFIIFGGSRWKGEVLTRKVLTNQDMLSL